MTALLSGCALPEFSMYSGQQQDWPTQPGAFVNTQFGLPIYVHSYPSRPYNVIGYLQVLGTPPGARYAVQKAKALGADAMIYFEAGSAGSLNIGNAYTSGGRSPGGFNANTTGSSVSLALTKADFIAIKWR